MHDWAAEYGYNSIELAYLSVPFLSCLHLSIYKIRSLEEQILEIHATSLLHAEIDSSPQNSEEVSSYHKAVQRQHPPSVPAMLTQFIAQSVAWNATAFKNLPLNLSGIITPISFQKT